MITNLDQLISLAKGIDGLTDAYRNYPEATPVAPFAIFTTISNTVDLRTDDEETIATITFQVDIYADDPAEAEDLASAMDILFNQYGIMRIGYYDGYGPSEVGLHRVTISFRAVLDKRGNTYN